MKTSKLLLILAAILSFDLSLFQAAISLRPRWSAAFGAPPALLEDRGLLVAAGFFAALVVAICGLYALSGAGVIPRLPFVRLGLLGIGSGYVFLGATVVTRLVGWSDVMPEGAPVQWRLMVAGCVAALTGLSYLAGLGLGWRQLSAKRREVFSSDPAPRCYPTPAS